KGDRNQDSRVQVTHLAGSTLWVLRRDGQEAAQNGGVSPGQQHQAAQNGNRNRLVRRSGGRRVIATSGHRNIVKSGHQLIGTSAHRDIGKSGHRSSAASPPRFGGLKITFAGSQ